MHEWEREVKPSFHACLITDSTSVITETKIAAIKHNIQKDHHHRLNLGGRKQMLNITGRNALQCSECIFTVNLPYVFPFISFYKISIFHFVSRCRCSNSVAVQVNIIPIWSTMRYTHRVYPVAIANKTFVRLLHSQCTNKICNSQLNKTIIHYK